MEREILGSRDILFLPEYETGLISKTVNPYEYRLDRKNYTLKSIYRAASLSGYRRKDVTEKQLKMLSDPNKIVRYWAITGLHSQNKKT